MPIKGRRPSAYRIPRAAIICSDAGQDRRDGLV
jgi:hypothetical protein